MARIRPLLPRLSVTRLYDYEQVAREFASRYPGWEAHSDETVAEFAAVAHWIDALPTETVLRFLRRRGVPVPKEFYTDRYRIGRYLFSRWLDPAVQEAISGMLILDPRTIDRLKKNPDVQELCRLVDQLGSTAATWAFCQAGVADRIPEVAAALPAEEASCYRGSLIHAAGLLQHYLTQPPSRERQPSRRAQKEMIRRIRRRELQLRSMRRDVYVLGRERKAWIARMRQAEREAEAELSALSARLEQVRQELAAAEVRHAAMMTELAARNAAELAALDAQVSAALVDFAEAVAERQSWAPVAPLNGTMVAVVGDSGRAAGYRVLVESAGGRFVYASAVEKLHRVPEVVATADVVILIAAAAKHSSEALLRKAVRPEALVLRCPKAGLASFERVLREEVLLRPSASAEAGQRKVEETIEGLAVHAAGPGSQLHRAGANRGGAGKGRPRSRRHR